MKTYLNMIDVAGFLRESHETLLEWLETGDGPHWFERGGKILYHVEDVKAFKEERQREWDRQFLGEYA